MGPIDGQRSLRWNAYVDDAALFAGGRGRAVPARAQEAAAAALDDPELEEDLPRHGLGVHAVGAPRDLLLQPSHSLPFESHLRARTPACHPDRCVPSSKTSVAVGATIGDASRTRRGSGGRPPAGASPGATRRRDA